MRRRIHVFILGVTCFDCRQLYFVCYRYNVYEMTVSTEHQTPWLLLVFSLPAKSASQRVEIWRKLQRYGTLPLRSAGHVLPNSATNQEHMEWLAAAIRSYKGQASVVQVAGFDDMSPQQLRDLFVEARSRDYQKLLHDLKRFLAVPPSRRMPGHLKRVRRRFHEIQEIDFFEGPLKTKVDAMLSRADDAETTESKRKRKTGEYIGRIWMTRPRPGIDRVSSAWLIRRYIDPKARFVFGAQPSVRPDAIPFDMFCPEGFGHRGENCTFETLCKHFAIRDSKVKHIAQIIHDADLGDEKFGRVEGQGLDKVLKGWAKQDLSDVDLLKRGSELIEGLYESMR